MGVENKPGKPSTQVEGSNLNDLLYEKLMQIGDFLSATNCPFEEMQAALNSLEIEGLKDPIATIAKCDMILNPPEELSNNSPKEDLSETAENSVAEQPDFDFELEKWKKMREKRKTNPVTRRKKYRY